MDGDGSVSVSPKNSSSPESFTQFEETSAKHKFNLYKAEATLSRRLSYEEYLNKKFMELDSCENTKDLDKKIVEISKEPSFQMYLLDDEVSLLNDMGDKMNDLVHKLLENESKKSFGSK